MKQVLTYSTMAGIALAACIAVAQSPADPPDQGGGGGPPPGAGGGGGVGGGQGRHRPPDSMIVRALDANGDHVIDASEIANATAELKTLDKNGDGQLTPDEYMPQRPGGARNGRHLGANGKRPRPPLIAALDVNGDGIIDATELANAPAALAKLDKNGDGKLTPDEWRPHRPPPGGDGDNGPGGPDDGPGDGNGPPNGPPPQQ